MRFTFGKGPAMSAPFRTILLFGAPGSGKGTQGKILGQVPGFFHLSCGDVFRALQPESPLARTFLEYSSHGKLVPDDLTVRLWQDHARRLVDSGRFTPENEVLILDGIPRNVPQAELMQQYIEVRHLVYLETHDEEKMVARLNRRALHDNRLDDTNEEVIRRRFAEYQRETAPVLEFYPAHLIHTVDAGNRPMQVLAHIIEGIVSLQI
jgi:adenylate kinase